VELPEHSVTFEITWDEEEKTGIGYIAHFHAILTGYETLEYTIQWQYNDGTGWYDVDGANDITMDVEITPDNYNYQWRLVTRITAILVPNVQGD
jgi:hypothetical protein